MSFLHVPNLVKVLDDKGNMTVPWLAFFTQVANLLNEGYPPPVNNSGGVAVPASVKIITAKLTTAEGSMTFTNGILTDETPAT